jgi:Lhr-like helicase
MTSGAREILTGAEAVIVDEIHAVAQSKRGAHLALTLERLSHLAATSDPDAPAAGNGVRDVQRIGLSATQRPLDRIARFPVGPRRRCEIADAGKPKELDLEIVVPVEDMTEPMPAASSASRPGAAGSGEGRADADRGGDHALHLAGDLPELLKLVRGAHLDDHLRQQPSRRRAPGQAPQRARRTTRIP